MTRLVWLISLSLIFCVGGLRLEDLDDLTRPSAAERPGVLHAIVTGQLLTASGEPIAGARVTLTDVRPEGLAGKVESAIGTISTDASGRFELAAVDVRGTLWLHQLPPPGFAELSMPLDVVDGEHTDLGELRIASIAPTARDPESRVSGKLETVDGRPLAGCLVLAQLGRQQNDLVEIACTDDQGTFASIALERPPRALSFRHPSGGLQLSHDAAAARPQGTIRIPHQDGLAQIAAWMPAATPGQKRSPARPGPSADLLQPLALEVEETVGLELTATNCDVSTVRYSWWNGRGWLPLAGSSPPLIQGEFGDEATLLRAEAAGHLPVVARVRFPGWRGAASATVRHTFDFAGARDTPIIVVHDGAPVPGALITIDLLLGGQRPERIALGTFPADAQGQLVLAADAAARYEVFVHADGFAPARATLQAGSPVTIALVRRTAAVRFTGLKPWQRVRIMEPGCSRPIGVVHPDAQGVARAELAPGRYEAISLQWPKQPLGMTTFTARAGEEVVVAAGGDERPRVRVHLPPLPRVGSSKQSVEPAWRVNVSRGASAGSVGGSGALSVSFSGASASPTDESPGEVEQVSATEYVVKLAGSGRFQIRCEATFLGQTFSHDVDVLAGETVELTMPPLDAILRGSMQSYKPRRSWHGVCGPRLTLLADRLDEGRPHWDATVYMPDRLDDGSFQIVGLPAGRYHLYQHLVGTTKTRGLPSGEIRSFPGAAEIWGGIAVELEPNNEVTVADFAEHVPGTLRVRLTDRCGKPISAARLMVRDRLWEGWHDLRRHSTLGDTDPIPEPPAVAIEDGVAELPSIRAGRLELIVVLPDGRCIACTRDVDPARELALELDV